MDAKKLADSINYDLEKDNLDIKNALDSNIKKYENDIESMLKDNPLASEQKAIYTQKLNYKHIESSPEILKDLLLEIKKFDNKFNTKFYINEIDSIESKQDSKIPQIPQNPQDSKNIESKQETLKELHKNILNEWEKSYQNRLKALQEKKADSIKQEMIKRLKEWLKALQQTQNLFNQMGEMGEIFKKSTLDSIKDAMASGKSVEDSELDKLINNLNQLGKGTDRATGKLHKKMRTFEHFMKLLQKDSIKKLCEMLGKLQKAHKKNELESFSKSETYNIKTPTPYAKEEIIGVTLGRDLENVLPFEYALLKDSEFSILFDMKFAENRLFCFQKQGYIDEILTREIAQQREKEVEDKKGPVILCVDTSGSMSGEPETIAKAVSLFIAKMAMEQKRACYLINFSTDIKTLDLSAPAGLFSLIEFLELSFDGGTDSIPALKEALRKCEDSKYQKADILMISDFVFDSTNERELRVLRSQLDKNKERENKLHALYVGDFKARDLSRNGKIFDNELIYNPYTKSVIQPNKDSNENYYGIDNIANFIKNLKDIF
ncbi:VWA domain-containing protein [Helicobacter saguini]|uniref:VWA domain-containing protein n=1 Tax=Helicobacter saguini TaxID=1548018 RepID=A0A347VVS6_9HELI|nr:VWA domain-containing protein [Helicobacter saguini]MWV62303.1 VWA domain-containing protein [Helicobacter saguini]MWV67024.1 VWA domain-containing protein [Helicobacter saguini]MWV69373.1 VWA domain-containing protein [Helicobacter saguini]MWV71072.1 VWA domain-containing protein [Helicobacter saguini]TLD95027.1 VWA domain-containing protein [Helicobacter saguini]